jgi:hypothetical protein
MSLKDQATEENQGMTEDEYLRLCLQAGIWAGKVDSFRGKPHYKGVVLDMVTNGVFCAGNFRALVDMAVLDGIPSELETMSVAEQGIIEESLRETQNISITKIVWTPTTQKSMP